MTGENRGAKGKTYADYLRQGTKVNGAYIMPKEAKPAYATKGFQPLFIEGPVPSGLKKKLNDRYIRLAKQRERKLNRNITERFTRAI